MSDDRIPEEIELNGTVRLDESGDVDLSLIEYMLSLTPLQRLVAMQDFANSLLRIRKLNGIQEMPWQDH